MLVLGIMSGTSMDGVDYSVCEIGAGVCSLGFWHVNFPKALRVRLHAAAAGRSHSHEIGQLHHDLGRFYAVHAEPALAVPLARGKLAVAGLHGQTVFHNPGNATLQLGEPAYLAQALGCPVVSNFRAADIAAGGQGAPLATMFHKVVFAQRGKQVCVNNLGGISNVTSLDWTRGASPRILAFDTGPANILINVAMRHFTKGKRELDLDGAWAAKGKPDEALLKQWLQLPYFRKKPPKSTGRERFGESFLQPYWQMNPFDLVATLTEFTARSIALNYKLHLPSVPDRVILAGGGVFNPSLVAALKRVLPNIEHSSWPVQAIEPAAFALLAYLRIKNKPGNIPKTTGARRPALLGQITVP